MQFVAQGALAGAGGCQTLGQVSEQMDSLLARQSSQRILPNESCLLAKKREQSSESQEGHTAGDDTRAAKDCRTTRARLIKAYSPRMKLCPYRTLFCAQWSSAPTTSLSTTQKYTPHTHTKTNLTLSLPTLALRGFLFLFFLNHQITEKWPHHTLTAKTQRSLTQGTRGFSLLCSTWAQRRWFPRKAC